MSKRFEIHVLVNAGRPHVGEWRMLERAVDEPAAMSRVEQLRANDRRERGWASSYRVVERRRADGWVLLPMLRFPADIEGAR